MTADDLDLWLYGSQARGDADAESDVDVLVVADNATAGRIWASTVCRGTTSVYAWDELIAMSAYGSLFLDHVKRDGKRLASRGDGAARFDALIANLPPYTRARLDLEAFAAALVDCEQSLAHGGWPDYELEVIVTVARHAALLGAYCAGTPDYGRDSCFVTAGEILQYPNDVIHDLQTSYRLFRRSSTSPQSIDAAALAAPRVLASVQGFVADLEEVITNYATASEAPAGRQPCR